MTNEKEEKACGSPLWYTIEFVEACGFYRQFHTLLHIEEPDFRQLHDWLCVVGEVPEGLRLLHLDLLKLRHSGCKMRSFKRTFLKRTISQIVRHYCIRWFPRYSKEDYNILSPIARLAILRHLQDNVLSVHLLQYPNDMIDQHVGTGVHGMRYMLRLWAKPDQQFHVYKVDQQNNVLIGRDCQFTTRTQLRELIQQLDSVRRLRNESQYLEQKQLVTFLTLLLPHFPK